MKYLEEMVNRRQTISWASRDPKAMSYRLREAMYAAQQHPEFSHLHDLRYHFEIKMKPGSIIARYIGPDVDPVELSPEGVDGALKKVQVEEVTNLSGVVGAAINFRDQAEELYFPNAVMMHHEKERLFNWGQEAGWKLIDHEDGGVTITKREVEPEMLWTPDHV